MSSEIEKYKLAISIKKYNSQTRKINFIEDFNSIKSQNIVYEFENFIVDFDFENNLRIENGLRKFEEIFSRKSSSLSNENLIFTISILNENFFNNINLESFYNKLFDIMNECFDILSFVVTKDPIGDITFYFVTTTVVTNIFLDHIQNKILSSGKTIEEMRGVLSYNLILGGSIAEKPEKKFVNLLLSKLNENENFHLEHASEIEKMNYLINSYDRASFKITEMEYEFNELINSLINSNIITKDLINKIIMENNIKYLKIKQE